MMPYSCRSIGGRVLFSLSYAVQPVDGYTTESVMHGQCDAKPTKRSGATAPSPWLVRVSYPAENRRLS